MKSEVLVRSMLMGGIIATHRLDVVNGTDAMGSACIVE